MRNVASAAATIMKTTTARNAMKTTTARNALTTPLKISFLEEFQFQKKTPSPIFLGTHNRTSLSFPRSQSQTPFPANECPSLVNTLGPRLHTHKNSLLSTPGLLGTCVPRIEPRVLPIEFQTEIQTFFNQPATAILTFFNQPATASIYSLYLD